MRLLALTLLMTAMHAVATDCDLALIGGRVMDPETGLDAIRNVCIVSGGITAVTTDALHGKRTEDVSGQVVAPGFIDLHAHSQDPRSMRFQAADGVTTALELEQGVYPVADWLVSKRGKSPIHYGASSGHLAARILATTGIAIGNPVYAQSTLASDAADSYANAPLQGEALDGLVANIEKGLKEGGLGIGSGITYMPGASQEEVLALFRLAARYQVPVFPHIRQARQLGGNLLSPLQEVLADAAATGAPLHIVHINSSLDESAREAMAMIRGMRERGLDVTTEMYPYTAGSTRLESALFENYTGDYGQLQWTETGERLTKETFGEYRKKGGWVIIHGRSEATNTWLVAQPDTMIASDSVPYVGDFSHPRSAGTYARVLGHYVRELNALPLMLALRKMTLEPAKRLEAFSPTMRRKGRLQAGMDADITVFDPDTVLDMATYTVPARTSAGITHVIVKGTFVVDGGELRTDVFPGEAVTSSL